MHTVGARAEWILTSLLTSMETQQHYWAATDFCIEHLIRMAKKSPECYSYLQGLGSKMDWVLTWLLMHQRPSNGNGMSYYKPSRVVNEWQGNGGYPSHTGLAIPLKKEFLDAVKEQKECELLGFDDAEDSDMELDDRVFEKGQLVDVLYHRMWKKGRVVEVNGEKVCVATDGWTEEWNEWFPMKSTMVMPRGMYTDKPLTPVGGGLGGIKRSSSDTSMDISGAAVGPLDLGSLVLSDDDDMPTPGAIGQDALESFNYTI
jgi:hypothetical protein